MIGLWLFAFVIAVALSGPEAHHENYHPRSPHTHSSEMDVAPSDEIHSQHQHDRQKTTNKDEPVQNKETHDEHSSDAKTVGSGSSDDAAEFTKSHENAKSAVRKSASASSLPINPHSRNQRSAADATYLMSYPNPKSYYSRKTQQRTGRDYCDYFEDGEEGYAYCCYY